MSQRAIPRSLSASALRTWATAQRAVRPASLAASAPPAVFEAIHRRASVRAARPLASGALPKHFVVEVRVLGVASREACRKRSFHSRSHGIFGFTRRAAWACTSQGRRSLLPYPVPSVSARDANQSTVAFGSAAGVGVCSVALVQPASKIKAVFAFPGALPNPAINRTASGSRLSPR